MYCVYLIFHLLHKTSNLIILSRIFYLFVSLLYSKLIKYPFNVCISWCQLFNIFPFAVPHNFKFIIIFFLQLSLQIFNDIFVFFHNRYKIFVVDTLLFHLISQLIYFMFFLFSNSNILGTLHFCVMYLLLKILNLIILSLNLLINLLNLIFLFLNIKK